MYIIDFYLDMCLHVYIIIHATIEIAASRKVVNITLINNYLQLIHLFLNALILLLITVFYLKWLIFTRIQINI